MMYDHDHDNDSVTPGSDIMAMDVNPILPPGARYNVQRFIFVRELCTLDLIRRDHQYSRGKINPIFDNSLTELDSEVKKETKDTAAAPYNTTRRLRLQ
jgi:hypothetical protein